jgi:hypothetical protein
MGRHHSFPLATLDAVPCWPSGSNVPRTRNYYQISKVDQQRKQEQMVAEVEGLREAEKLVEKHLQNMKSSEKKEITYRVSKLLTRDS